MLQVFVWWLLLQILGLAALPLAYHIFQRLPGRGYAFAKPLGLLLTSYILWLGSSLGYLKNTSAGIVVAIALTLAGSLWIYWRAQKEGDTASLVRFLKQRARLVLMVEILFTVSFAAWALFRAYAPDKIMSSGGEKFMEIAFLNAVLRSSSFPPHDPWLSGFAISYYHFGYVMMGLLTRLSGAVSGVGFELYDALMFALTVTGGFGVVHSLVASQASSSEHDALRFGVLGSFFVAVMGNLEGLLEAVYARGLLPESFWRWIDVPDLLKAGRVTGSWYPGHGWWWWRASRVIRDRNLMGEPILSPIDEFPFFSFLLGDNHPHVLALPFVLLAIGLAFNLLYGQWKKTRQEEGSTRWWNPVAYALDGDWELFMVYAVGVGSLGFLNTWDFPVYLGLTALAYGAGRYATGRESLTSVLKKTAVLAVSLTVIGVLLYLPFYISFSSQAGGILPYLLPPTRLPQYLVMFGPFIFVGAWFLISQVVIGDDTVGRVRAAARAWGIVAAAPIVLLLITLSVVVLTESGRRFVQGVLSDPQIQQAVGSGRPGVALRAVILARLRDPWLFLMLSLLIGVAGASILRGRKRDEDPATASAGTQFASLLLLCGLGLTFVVEFVYLRDIFGVRMNTIFKFYYQAWVMLACASAFGVWWVLNRTEVEIGRAVQSAFLVGVVLLMAGGLIYPLMAGYSRVEGFEHAPRLDGTVNIARNHPDDWAAIEWLRENAADVPVILEAPGANYVYEGRISAFTGYPAVLGWASHERQWRGNYKEQGKREPDIATIYTSPDEQKRLELLRKWDVDYVVVGPPERRYVEKVCQGSERTCSPTEALRRFDQFLHRVFEQGQTRVYRVPES